MCECSRRWGVAVGDVGKQYLYKAAVDVCFRWGLSPALRHRHQPIHQAGQDLCDGWGRQTVSVTSRLSRCLLSRHLSVMRTHCLVSRSSYQNHKSLIWECCTHFYIKCKESLRQTKFVAVTREIDWRGVLDIIVLHWIPCIQAVWEMWMFFILSTNLILYSLNIIFDVYKATYAFHKKHNWWMNSCRENYIFYALLTTNLIINCCYNSFKRHG